jgi:hypothetical protein
MDDLALAAEKIDAALDALATAAARHPSLREDFEWRAVRLLELRDEIDRAKSLRFRDSHTLGTRP